MSRARAMAAGSTGPSMPASPGHVSVRRTAPISHETTRSGNVPVPTAYSVLPPPVSITPIVPPSAGSAETAPRYDASASSSPVSTCSGAPTIFSTRAAKAAPFSARRTALVATATTPAVRPRIELSCVRTAAIVRAIASSLKRPRSRSPSPKRVPIERAKITRGGVSSRSARRTRVELVPIETIAFMHRSARRAASSSGSGAVRRARHPEVAALRSRARSR